MINGIEIKNFKMFEELSIKRLAPVTLVGGMNNVGKSSLLEGISIATARDNPNLLLKLLAKRRITRVENSAEGMWFPFFYKFYERNEIEFRTSFESAEQPEITKITYERIPPTRQLMRTDGTFIEIDGDVESSDVHKLKINADGREFEQLLSGQDRTFVGYPPTVKHDVYALWTDCRSSKEISLEVEKVDKKNAIGELVQFVQIIAPEVRDISAATEGVLVDYGFKKKINAALSGEGVMRSLSIASIVIADEPEILLIDEVENGLHYSVQPKFWEALSFLGNKKNVQIIAATHSRECIEAAVKGMKANNLENDFAFVRLQRNKKDAEKISAVEMTAEDVSDMSERDWEIR